MKKTWLHDARSQFDIANLILSVFCGVCLGVGIAARYFATEMLHMTGFDGYADEFKNLENMAETLILAMLGVIFILVLISVRRGLKKNYSAGVEGRAS